MYSELKTWERLEEECEKRRCIRRCVIRYILKGVRRVILKEELKKLIFSEMDIYSIQYGGGGGIHIILASVITD